jgi:hypothetical protein
MIPDKILQFTKNRKCTLLGVGPMSKNCVDATIELSNEFDIPLFLVASRRQIEASFFGGGYANNWSTEEFANYIKQNDIKNNIFLTRDHGGPWHNSEDLRKKISLEDAMTSAKKSYQIDIDSGFTFLHIDPSEYIETKPTPEKILALVFELYSFCYEYAKSKNHQISFEISVGKDGDESQSFEELSEIIKKIKFFCDEKNYPLPVFLAVRIGTHVKEDRNVGDFESKIDLNPNENKIIHKLIQLCNENCIMMKHHNTDYLSDEALKKHFEWGIHAANVAPEFGVVETRALLKLLEDYGLTDELNQFIDIAYNSKKWEKWLVPNSTLDKKGKATIAGHYIFTTKDFLKLKDKIKSKLPEENIDNYLKNEVKNSILRYMKNFNLL